MYNHFQKIQNKKDRHACEPPQIARAARFWAVHGEWISYLAP